VKIYKENGELVIDGEKDFIIKKSPFTEDGFITAIGFKLSEGMLNDGDKLNLTNFYQCQIGINFFGQLKALWYAVKFIFLEEVKSDGN